MHTVSPVYAITLCRYLLLMGAAPMMWLHYFGTGSEMSDTIYTLTRFIDKPNHVDAFTILVFQRGKPRRLTDGDGQPVLFATADAAKAYAAAQGFELSA